MRNAPTSIWIACAGMFTAAVCAACPFDDHGQAGDGGNIDPGAFPFLIITSAPSDEVMGPVIVEYRVYDEIGVPVDIVATWSGQGVLAGPATPGEGTNLMLGIDTSPEGVALTFVWNSSADYPGDLDEVELCLQASSASGVSEPVCTPLDLRNAIPGADQVRISEIFTGADDRVELINAGTATVDLGGLALSWTDTSGLSDVVLLTGAFLLDPGARVVLRENVGPATPGVLDLGVNISWSNATGGSVELLDLLGESMDFARWGQSAEPPGAGGAWTQMAALPTPPYDTTTLSRVAPSDTDSEVDFCLTAETAGSENGACIPLGNFEAGELLITEVATRYPAWAEVVNTTTSTVSLFGVRLEWSSVPGSGAVVLPDVDLPAGNRFVVSEQGGIPGALAFVGPALFNWSLAAGGGTAAVVNANGTGVDFLRWGELDPTGPAPGVGWDDSAGVAPNVADTASLARSPDLVDTDTPQDFCVAIPTPLATNGTCLADGTESNLVITEVSCGVPDWVEVMNVGALAVDLVGWRLGWSTPGGSSGGLGPSAGVLPLPSYSLGSGERVVLTEVDAFVPNQIVFWPEWTGISWGPGTGWSGAAVLADPYGLPEDFVRWGTSTAMTPGAAWAEPGGGVPAPLSDEEHLNRDEALGDNDLDTDWCGANPGTIGMPNDPCP